MNKAQVVDEELSRAPAEGRLPVDHFVAERLRARGGDLRGQAAAAAAPAGARGAARPRAAEGEQANACHRPACLNPIIIYMSDEVSAVFGNGDSRRLIQESIESVDVDLRNVARRWTPSEDNAVRLARRASTTRTAAAAWSSSPIGSAAPRPPFVSPARGRR